MTPGITRLRRGAVVLVLTITAAIVGYHLIFKRTLLDAIYMTVITLATIGYGEHSQLPPAEQLFTIVVIIIGLAASAYTIGGFVNMALEGEVEKALGLHRANKAIERMHDHVIICGYGRVGQILASELDKQRTPFVIIDRDPAKTAMAANENHITITGDATEEEVLNSVGITRAKTLVTAFPNDAANVFITLTARDLNPHMQIIARAEQPSTQKKLIQAGANRVVLPASIGAQRIAALITRPSTLELMELVAGRSVMDVVVDEIVIPAKSPMIGKTVMDTEARRRHGLLVVAVKRAEGSMIFNPDTNFTFKIGDVVIVMGKPDDIARCRTEYGV
jgi:voltage-gated potassium channel